MLESEIKSNCKKDLTAWGWMVIHLIQSNLNGIPDTLIIRAGQHIFIEFKQPGKNPEPLQEYRHKKIREQGGTVIVVRSSHDIQHLK